MYKALVVFCLLAGFYLNASSQEDSLKRLYLGNDTHTDLMWNGDEETWTEWTREMAEFYVTFSERSANRPREQQVKWNYDAAWCLYTLEKNTDPDFFGRVISQIQRGQASVPYTFTLPVYGGFTAETILRSFYYGGYLERKFDIDVDLAIAMENSVVPLGLASLWAGSGAKYSWKGVCNCATKIDVKGQRDHEMYWYTGLDGSRILMKWYSTRGWNAELGGYSEMLEPTIAVQQMNDKCGTEHYPYAIAAAFGKGWDNGRNFSIDVHAGVRHRTLPGTQVILSNELDFFQDFENSYGDILPSESLAYGNEWDLYPASLPSATNQLRRSMEKLRLAEAMATVTTRIDPDIYNDLWSLRDDFYYGISVYSLHGWTADGPWVSRDEFADWAREQQRKVSDYVDTLYERTKTDLGNFIDAGEKENSLFVFNALGFERDGLISLPAGRAKTPELRRDGTGERIKVYQSGNKAYFIARDIPPSGYAVFEWVEPRGKELKNDAFRVEGNELITPFYKVAFGEDGSITSLLEVKSGKQWVSTALNKMGKGGQPGESTPPAKFLNVAFSSPDLIELEFISDLPYKHHTWIRFYSDDPRIDIKNKVLENFKDSLYYTFDMNIENPEVWHEEIGAVIKAKLSSEGGHYADKRARYDHLSFNHFLWMGNDNQGMIISNLDCPFFRLGNSIPRKLDSGSSTIHALVGGMIDDKRGIYELGGDSVFVSHFSLLPAAGPFDQTKAMRFALEHQNPLVQGTIFAEGNKALPGKEFSLLKTTDPNVLLWGLKPGIEGGTVLRFWNMSDPVDLKIQFDTAPESVFEATHVETPTGSVPVTGKTVGIPFRQQQLKTLKVSWE